ncbi:MAG: DNA-3-methyladenine glycosylase I [Candidatus Woesearchaeota archaeon]
MSIKKQRCPWTNNDKLMIKYHDEEWGKPIHDDKKLFEFIILESAQAGLSWRTILYIREEYKKAFADFDFNKIAKFTSRDVEKLMNNAGIIRNRLKILATINNAQRFIEVQKEFGTFDKYIWSFVKNKPIINKFKTLKELPARTKLSDKISMDLKKRGFKFMGSTIAYSYMQAIGIINDHLTNCYRKRK